MWVIGWHEHLLGSGMHLFGRSIDSHLKKLCPLTTVDRKGPMRWHSLNVLGIIEVITKVLLVFGESFAFTLNALALEVGFFIENAAETLPEISIRAKLIGNDVSHSE